MLKNIMNNFTCLTIGDFTIWFSYETPIAYKNGNDNVVIRQNKWGRTTGKHINHIKANNGYIQIDDREFEYLISLLEIVAIIK